MAFISDCSFQKRILKNKYKNVKLPILEKHVESIIINNLNKIEKGMRIISNQYKVDDGIIDILAEDIDNTKCIIEIKNDSDSKDLIYQALYYPMQFKEKTRMITLCPSYIYSIYSCLNKLNYVELKKYYIDNKDNIVIENF